MTLRTAIVQKAFSQMNLNIRLDESFAQNSFIEKWRSARENLHQQQQQCPQQQQQQSDEDVLMTRQPAWMGARRNSVDTSVMVGGGESVVSPSIGAAVTIPSQSQSQSQSTSRTKTSFTIPCLVHRHLMNTDTDTKTIPSTVPIDVYYPEDVDLVENPEQPLLPIIIFTHGGGWVAGQASHYNYLGAALADTQRAVVVVPNYSLAPESPYPQALDEILTVYRWLCDNGEQIHGDSANIGLVGDSAGGNLTASTVLRIISYNDAERKSEPTAPELIMLPRFQVLFYPVLDVSRFDRPSHDKYGNKHLITSRALRLSRWMYLNRPPINTEELQTKSEDPFVSPLLATNLGEVCPTIVVGAQHDILYSEGVLFVDKLVAEGVNATHIPIKGVMHGFMKNLFPSEVHYVTETIMRPWIQSLA